MTKFILICENKKRENDFYFYDYNQISKQK